MYVGKAKDLKSRVSSYFTAPAGLGPKTKALVAQIKNIRVVEVESEVESLLLEAFYIKTYKPRYNIRMQDSKSYPLVRITIKEKYPSVTVARREDDTNSLYFGPFPSSSSVRLVLRTIRKIFPFVSTLNHAKRVCLYHHLGLCPCPQMFDSLESQKAYKATIKSIVGMFEGDTKKVLKSLEKQRDEVSSTEDYEKAGELQKKINALTYVTQPVHTPFEYHTNPNLRTDLREKELKDLMAILNNHGYNLTQLDKIECYDISNTQGTNATASQVVFVNGEKDGSLYRRYKIKIDGKPNDFAMMEEVLTRRLKNTQWTYPDLFIVDGGKGQISSGLKAMEIVGVTAPLIGLAKREETIITSDNQEIKLPKNSGSLQLIQRLRDEAHRFALTYHRKLRSKAMVGIR